MLRPLWSLESLYVYRLWTENVVRNANKLPNHLHHKTHNLGYVKLDGRVIYTGKWATPECKGTYERLIAEWLINGKHLPSTAAKEDIYSIANLVAEFKNHAKGWYRHSDGTPTNEIVNINIALRPLEELYGSTPARDFGPTQLKALRGHLLYSPNRKRKSNGLCRNVINQRISIVKRMFRWGVEEGKVPPDLYHGLTAVRMLVAGRTSAPETEPVKPVSEAHALAVLPHVSPHIAAMIQLQWWTGMRPSEVTTMRMRDIDMTASQWIYRPVLHKTAHFGKKRTIALGARAREVLRPFICLDREAYLFSVEKSQAARRAIERANRKQTRLSPWQIERDAARRRAPKEKLNNYYNTVDYRQAIVRGCEKAGVPPWSPNQLRHSAATRIRKEFGLEAARVVLGHTSALTTSIYAEIDEMKAQEVMEKCG
ncbi:MAG: site-specific integrase [Planctomycetes bacterium]|nr:site-specific integrase [Planctomycetota bacterium]